MYLHKLNVKSHIHIIDRNEITFLSSDDDEFAMIVIGILPKECVYRNRYDPSVEYDDANFVRRFR